MTVNVIQHLWFERGMDEAVRFYTSLIPGSTIEWISAVPGAPAGPAGSVHLAAFTLGDQRYRAIEAGPLDQFNHSFSVIVECEDQAEIDRLWDALSEGGLVEQCGWLKDR
jgi:predicted 3-demethylubiquinone-9 3-methyltransferase (glyoxalase superfamily)